MSDEEKRTDGLPPPSETIGPEEYCRIDWARVDQPLRFACLVAKPYGVYLHWAQNGSRLCAKTWGEDLVCARCPDQVRTSGWYAFVLGHCLRTADTVLAMVPEKSYYRAAHKLENTNLAGRLITLTRPHAYSVVNVEVSRQQSALRFPVVSADDFGVIIDRVYQRIETPRRKEKRNEQQ